jgi:hypothetical protein
MRGSVMQRVSRRSVVLGGLSLAALSALPANATDITTLPLPRLRLLGEATLPHRLQFHDTTVGGLSALDYDPVDDLWYALSDDRSDINPARLYTLRMRISHQGLSQPALQSVVLLKQADGSPYPSRKQGHGTVPDPEGLRFRPQTRTLLWSSEGDSKLGLDPFVREMRLDGQHLRELTLPSHFHTDPSATQGPRNNLAFEGLAISPDGLHLWAAMESPLLQDGPVATVGSGGGPCRFTCWDMATGQATRQITYQPDAVPLLPLVAGTYADNGVSEILMQSAQHMLVLERAYSLGTGNSLRLYRINVDSGTNTLNHAVLQAGHDIPAPKTLVANFNQLDLNSWTTPKAWPGAPTWPGTMATRPGRPWSSSATTTSTRCKRPNSSLLSFFNSIQGTTS